MAIPESGRWALAEALADDSFECETAPSSASSGNNSREAISKANTAAIEQFTLTIKQRLRRLATDEAEYPCSPLFEITTFRKKNGPLTKTITLSSDGSLHSYASECKMSRGEAWRFGPNSVTELAEHINHLKSDEAIALGALRPELPERVRVVTKRRLRKPGLTRRRDVIARSGEYLEYQPGRPVLVLIDIDTKGMTLEVRHRADEFGGYWPALTSVIPELASAARVARASTSAGIRRADTGQAIAGSDGQHILVVIQDGSDAERFLGDFHARCWLAGLGWYRIGAGGQLLDRSLVDRMVGRPERLIFEGPPTLDPLLIQDEEARRAVAIEGETLDSVAVCLPLSAEERARVADLQAQETEKLAPECAAARRAFLKRQARRLMDQNPGMHQAAAELVVERQVYGGVLLPSIKLDFADETLAGTTVGNVLENPELFKGEKLADPIEGPEYDPDCAYINLREDGTPWIYSFAHGRITYQLKYDAATIERAIEAAPADQQAAELFVKLMMLADDLDPIEVERLKNLTCKRSGIGARALMASLKKARAKVRREQRHDENNEPRPGTISLEDFYANLEMHNYIYTPTGKMWPAASVNARVSSQTLVVAGKPVFSESGNPIMIDANEWLDRNRAVEQITWVPGLPMIIRNKYVVEGGWVDRPNASCFNLYRPPRITLGNPNDIGPWMDHLLYVYPDDADHIINWSSHRVQRPHEKLNHALVLGGPQRIGKDTILQPVSYAIGPWNFKEASPKQILGRFNAYVKSVILRISEARDLGEFDRFAFYDHTKSIIAAPPDTLLVDEKHLREYYIPNVCGVIVTTNHKTDGIYLPPDDRRHYAAWSDRDKEDLRYQDDYFKKLWDWYGNGGLQNVAAYLMERDITGFDPKAPPPKTPAFWAIVDANRSPEEPELADVLDRLQRPAAITLADILEDEDMDAELRMWLTDRSARRIIPYRLEKVGYVPVRNPDAKDGYWVIAGKRQAIYAKTELSFSDQLLAATDLQRQRSQKD